ncbi:MAG: hypothetical protein U0228_11275 [Myxococcaceae bacterium]
MKQWRWIDWAFVAVGVFFFGGGAVFHAIAFFKPDISEPMPQWLHEVFVFVNLFFAVCFVRRVKWVAWPFAVLTAQQAWQHGGAFIAALRETPPHFDAQSFFALLGLVVVWVLIVIRARMDAAKPAVAA